MDETVAAYPGIFPQGGAEDETPGHTEEDPGSEAEPEGPADDFTARWGWTALIDTVSETFRCSWDDVWKKPIIETLNGYAYTKDRNAWREKEMEKYKRTH